METIEEVSTQFVNDIITNVVGRLSTKFISLGRHCELKEQIDNFFTSPEPTLFFDWLRSDFKAVLKVFSYKNILEELLFHDNILTYAYSERDAGVEFKNMILGDNKYFLLSHHDIESGAVLDKDAIQNFIDKYERRWNRIVEAIKQSSQNLIFIHRSYSTIDPGDENKFIELILNINPECKFCLVFLIHWGDCPDIIIEKRNKFLCINIESFLKSNYSEDIDWKLNQYDWNRIFETILHNARYDNWQKLL
jgi:hypothetical protein